MNDNLITDMSRKSESCNNVGIFVDFDNIYYTLKDYGVLIKDGPYDIFAMLEKIYSKNKIRTYRAYADYEQVKVSLKWMQEHRVQIRNVYGNGLEEHNRKNASDIELSIDAIESSYRNPEIDTFVFVTSDSDMIPVMSRLMYKNKKVHLYYVGEHISQYQNLFNMCDDSVDIIDILEIDRARSELSYWVDRALRVIDTWYANPKNARQTLGGQWLQKEFCETLHFNRKKAGDLIEYLLTNHHIQEQFTNNGGKYYVTNRANS